MNIYRLSLFLTPVSFRWTIPVKVLSNEDYRVWNQAQMISIDKWSSRTELFLKIKGTPSREEHKTGFGVFTTMELALSGQISII